MDEPAIDQLKDAEVGKRLEGNFATFGRSVFQDILSVFDFVLIGNPLTIKEVIRPKKLGGNQLFKMIGILSLFQKIEFQRISDLLELCLMDEMSRDSEVDRFYL